MKPRKTVWVMGGVLAALSACCVSCVIAGTLVDAGQVPGSVTNTNGLDGRYGCFQSRGVTGANGQLVPRWTAVAVPAFRLEGRSYSDANAHGAIEVEGNIIGFTGGPLDGWKGRLGADTKPFIAFAGENHHEVNSSTGDGWNDFKCYVQPD